MQSPLQRNQPRIFLPTLYDRISRKLTFFTSFPLLSRQEESQPYAFYIEDREVVGSLESHLTQHKGTLLANEPQ